jgi:hyperosmotically inducible periplasmic protein
MKKYLLFTLAAFAFLTLSQSCKKKMKDEDIQKSVMAEVAKMSDVSGGAVTVKDGIATITGVCKDQACSDKCKAALTDLKIKGVKEIKWDCTLAPPPASVATAVTDPKVEAAIKAAMKDMPGVTVAFENNKAVFSGTISAKQKTALAQACMAAKIAPDMTKVTVK